MSNLYLKPHPTLEDIQQYVREMVKERGFDKYDILHECLLLVEEVGELFKVIRKQGAKMHLDVAKQYELNASEEIADVLIMLTALANRMEIDIEQSLRDKEERNKLRVWR